MRLYIIRHADPDYETDSIDENGHLAARTLADYLASQNIAEIYSSPLGRAIETAQYTAEKLGVSVIQQTWLQELTQLWIPELDQTLWDLPGSRYRSDEFLCQLSAWNTVPPLNHPRLAAALASLRQQSDEFLAKQGFVRNGSVYNMMEPNEKQIAVFCHLGFGLTWLSHLLEIPLPLVWAGFYLYPTSITTILFEQRPDGIAVPRCLGLGDISHLIAQNIQPRASGLLANEK
jgi:probable phosphoglycerate mutase